jgi:predicted amidohydrolase
MTSGVDVEANLAEARRLVRAAARTADLVALPENFAWLRPLGSRRSLGTSLDGELVGAMADLARELGCHLLLGSIPERIRGSRRVHNTSVLLDRRGLVAAVYRKLHLFDAVIPGAGALRESRDVVPGDEPVVARTELGRLGLSVCYDLRFPELYRRLVVDGGAEMLLVPSAFTAQTGPHHWLPLLRARAIENVAWVVAPAQWGDHGGGRRSHGDSVIVDPWGCVVRRKRRGTGWISASIDLERVRSLRRDLPCLGHVRRELLPEPARRERPRAGRRRR